MRTILLAWMAITILLCTPVLQAQCEPGLDCNGNGQLDECDLIQGLSADCNVNGIPDECDITANPLSDCNQNGLLDSCEPVGSALLPGVLNGEVAMSGDTMLVSEAAAILEPGEVPGGEPAPPRRVDVYERVGSTWILQGSLTPSNSLTEDNFGMSVAIDGDLAAVGAPGSNGLEGAVYLFSRTGTTWSQVDILTSENPAPEDYYGMSVSVLGTDVMVGAPQPRETEPEIAPGGFAEMWSQVGTSWARTGHVGVTSPFAGGGEENGASVALGAGGWAFVGASRANAGAGRVHMYLQAGGSWLLVGSLLASDAGQNTLFGTQLETDGTTLVVVAERSPNVNGPIGAIYTFERTAVSWSQVDKTVSPLNANNTNRYGSSLALSGELLAVGEPGIDNQQGSTHLYRRDGNGWLLRDSVRPAAILNGDNFGSSVANNGDWTASIAGGIPSTYITHTELSEDCDGNGTDDRCDITSGVHEDCDGNGIPDSCDISSGAAQDCDGDLIPDACNLLAGAPDCNQNNVPDSCDISSGTSTDCNGDTIADDCQTDCDGNGIPDDCDLLAGTPDCNSNGIPDDCDVTVGFSLDCNGNQVPDSCDLAGGAPDCDGDLIQDSCEIAQGAIDCDGNTIPDACEIASAPSLDCNGNNELDSCDVTAGLSPDCDGNQIPDECQLAAGTSEDCNTNGVPDSCEQPNLVDTTPPQIVGTPGDMSGSADLGSCSTAMLWISPAATDNCGPAAPQVISSHASGTQFDVGVTTVTFTADDQYGNSTSTSFTITVTDDQNPQLNGTPPSMTQTAEAGACSASVIWLSPSSSDNCPGQLVTSSHASGDIFDVGTTTVTYTATDASANTVTTSFDVTVTDDEAPIHIGAPISQDLSSDPGSCGAVATWAAHSTSDNCGIASDQSTAASGDFFGLGPSTVTMTLIDIHGNVTTHEFTITVTDTEAPQLIGMPSSMTQTADAGSCGAVTMWTAPTTTDNCPDPLLTSSHQPGDNFPVGTTTVTYTSDDANGLSTSASFDITITDDELPVFDSAPGDMSLDTDPGSCETIVTWAEPLTSDNCGPNPLLSGTHISGSSFPIGPTTVTYTVEDQHGNSAQSSFVITISDNEVPTLSGVPASFTVTNDPDLCGATVSWTEPTAADNCGIAGTNSDVLSGSFLDVGDTTVTYATTDLNGNLTTQAFTVTVLDDEAPAYSGAPASQDLSSDPGSCGAVANWAAHSTSDNCGIASDQSTAASGDFFGLGATTATMTLTDIHGNTVTHQFTITVTDTEVPQLLGMPRSMTQTADAGSCGAGVSWAAPTTTDNCPDPLLSSSHQPGDNFPVGTTTVTYTSDDANGLSTSASFDITVTDDEAPAYSGAPASQDLSSDPGSCGAVANWAAHSNSDNCGVASDTSTSASGDFFGLGTTTVTMTLTDIHGNSTTHEHSITVTDTEAPMIHDLPASMTQTAEAGTCGATIMWAAPTTTDNCPGATLSSSHQPGENFPVGTTTVTYTADDANGLSTSASFDISITDDEAPAYSGAPASQDLSSDPGSCGAVATWAAHSTSDNCGIASDQSTAASGDFFDLGATTVTMTLTDTHGNSTTHQFTVTVTDTEAPTLTGMPASMSSTNDPDQCGAIAGWAEPTSSDNCAGETTSSTHSSGDYFEVGTTTVTYTVQDGSNNSTDYSFDITVTDDQAPEFDSAPADMILDSLPGQCSSTATWASVLSSDNCGSADLTSSAASGDNFDVGTTTVTMSLLDLHGNTARHNFTVTVVDNEFPQFDTTPSDLVLDTDPGQCGAIASWTPPTATDNCGLGAYVTSHLPGDTFDVGTTTVSYAQSDMHGNIVSGTLLVTVADNEAPNITTSGDITEPAPAGTCVSSVTIPTPSITDNCTVISLTNNLNGTDNASGSFDHGTTTIVWTGVDNHGNTTEVNQTVTVTVPQADCNSNGSPDVCDLASGISADCDGNGVPDECDVDCNQNGSPDACDIAAGLSIDCNGNGVPDTCDLESQDSLDTNANNIPDECEPAFLRGDANGDANVDIADAIFMLYSLMLGGTPSGCTDSTDANDDGLHDISDIIFVLNYQFQQGAPPPAPGPSQCGIDMTPDDGLGCAVYGGCP